MVAAYKYNTDTGTINIDTEDLLSDVQKEWTDVFGISLDLNSETPQGIMIGAETTNRAGLMKNNADVANLLNPNLSYGTFLDSLCAFLLKDGRGKNTSTIGVGIELNGDPDTEIQTGFRVKNKSGDIFYLTQNVKISTNRKGYATISSEESGAIPLDVGELTIVDSVIGWGSANVLPTTAVTLGTKELTDSQLKTFRNQTLFAMGLSSTGAIKANLLTVNNVTSCQIVENLTGKAGEVEGINFNGPGIWICVAGSASDQEVAKAAFAARQGACPYDYGINNGIPVQAPDGVPILDAYSMIYYNIKFTRAVEKIVFVRMKAKIGTSSANNISIARSIKNYADGLVEGEEGFVVGASISAFECAAAPCLDFPGLYVYSTLVAVINSGDNTPKDEDYVTEFPLKKWEIGTLAMGNINIELSK